MTLLPQELIRRKRDGHPLTRTEITEFVNGLTDGRVKPEQVSAFAMAVFFQGLSLDERVALTLAMRDSGSVLSWDGFDGPVVDKHSTGGIGDTVSLVLAPALAAAGCYVPMISGRGLGHTGGTLDKLDSIPGYTTAPDKSRFRKTVRAAGCAIIGQTDDLAPADRTFYAIRDVTGTVESRDLITASILSKKLAAGLDVLVLDVKCGSGAFMATEAAALGLAESLVAVANGAGTKTRALLTDMDEPLADAAGNALEVRVALDVLAGKAGGRLRDVTLALGGETLDAAGLAESPEAGRKIIDARLRDGSAAERFQRMVAELGGPGNLVDRPTTHLAEAPVKRPIHTEEAGIVTAVETRGLGLAVIELGGGRRAVSDPIDPSVGLSELAGLGDAVGPERPLAIVHARSEADADRAAATVRSVYRVSSEPLHGRAPLVIGRVTE